MADEIVGLKIKVGGDDVSKTFGTLKQQFKEANAEVQRMVALFGETSVEAAAAAKKASELREQIRDSKSLLDAYHPDAKFKSLTVSLTGVASGFSAVQGAMGLLGSDSKNVEQALLKVQSAMALSQGLQGISEAIGDFKIMKAVALDAFNSIKAAIGSTGIGLFVVALASIVAYWDKITESISGVSKELSNATDLAHKKTSAAEKELKALELQINALKLQGKTEKEILNIRIQKTAALINDANVELELIQKTGLAQIEKYTSIRNMAQSVLGAAGTGIADVILGGAIETTEKSYNDKKEFIDKAISDLNGFRLQVNEINKKEIEDSKKKRQADLEEKLKRDEAFQDKLKGAKPEDVDPRIQREVTYEDFVTKMSSRLINGAIANSSVLKQIDDATTASQLNNARLLAEGKKATFDTIMKATSDLTDVIGRDTAVGKGLAIAQATINTYLGASEVIKAKNPYAEPWGTAVKVASVASILLNGFKQVKAIKSTQVPKYGGGGIGGDVSMSAAPVSPAALQSQITTIDQNQINQIGNAAARAYVVESDVTNSQERIIRINRAARLN